MSIVLNSDSPNGEYSITLLGRTVVNGHFDITMNPSDQAVSALNFFEKYRGSWQRLGFRRDAQCCCRYLLRDPHELDVRERRRLRPDESGHSQQYLDGLEHWANFRWTPCDRCQRASGNHHDRLRSKVVLG